MTRYTVEVIVRSGGLEVERGSIPFDHVHLPAEFEPWDLAPSITRLLDFMERASEQFSDLRELLPDGMRKLATLFFTWDELEVLAHLVDDKLADLPPFPGRVDEVLEPWSQLNTLRTSLREAQSGLER